MSAPAAIARWIVAMVGDHGPSLSAFELRLDGETVYDKRVKDASLIGDIDSAQDLADDIHDAAISDAEGRDGSSAYRLYAVVADDDDIQCPRKLTCKGAALDSTRIVHEVFKQNQTLMGLIVRDREASSAHTSEMLRIAMQRNAELEKGRVELLQVREHILDRTHARELEAEKLEHENKLKADGMATVKLLAPAALAYFTEKKVPGAETPKEVLITELISQLDEDQTMQLMAVLKPSQKAALFAIMGAPGEDVSDGPPPDTDAE